MILSFEGRSKLITVDVREYAQEVFKICPRNYSSGTAVAQWLRYSATNRKVAGSIPDGVIGIFH
jgi:hypothetical protein